MIKPNERGKFNKYGGKFVPETIIHALEELNKAYLKLKDDKSFREELFGYLKDYVGRPTPLYFAKSLSEKLGPKIYLKREDLCHSGAHKINNTIGQVVLAKKMGKKRIIAETGAGQHGVATAIASAKLGLKCEVYMGKEDMRRQELNVFRMKLYGADVHPVKSGSMTLKDAINETMRDWVTNIETTYYCIGSIVGPHPYPMIVRNFQSIIGSEIHRQILEIEKKLPDYIIACVGGGSNAIGSFYEFLDKDVKLVGVEAGGEGIDTKKHSATLSRGTQGVLHGAYTYLLQDEFGQIQLSHSISAGLDYPGVGPELSSLKDSNRIKFVASDDKEVMDAFKILSETEGIMPALESAHAIAYLIKISKKLSKDKIVVVNLSGRGDKDIHIVQDYLGGKV